MPTRADIRISTPSGRPLAVMEVKNLPQLSLADAVDVRDAVVEHLARPVEYVLVASQARGFIWQRQGDEPRYGEPDVLDMTPVLREYLTEAELGRHIRGASLELIFSHWLGDLARGRVTRPAGAGEQGPFRQFTSDIRQAQVNFEALA